MSESHRRKLHDYMYWLTCWLAASCFVEHAFHIYLSLEFYAAHSGAGSVTGSTVGARAAASGHLRTRAAAALARLC